MRFDIQRLTFHDLSLVDALLAVFGEAFNDSDTYTGKKPGPDYLRKLFVGESFIALAALKNDNVVGGIAAYELKKFEQERSEIYIYDLAVLAGHRREGIATALIEELKEIAAARGAYVISFRPKPALKTGLRLPCTRNSASVKRSCTLI